MKFFKKLTAFHDISFKYQIVSYPPPRPDLTCSFEACLWISMTKIITYTTEKKKKQETSTPTLTDSIVLSCQIYSRKYLILRKISILPLFYY